MISNKPEVGDTYRYDEHVSPLIISASSIPPQKIIITVVAVSDQDVWYKRDDKSQTKQTSIERFMSIVKPTSVVTA